jgi:hypothetical protein
MERVDPRFGSDHDELMRRRLLTTPLEEIRFLHE